MRSNWARLVVCGVVGGAMLGLLALPQVALAGLAVRYVSDRYTELPSSLRTPTPAQTSYLYANDGKTLITTFADEDRTDVPLTSVAEVMRQAIVAAEDTRFYEHHGVDLRSVLRAIVADRSSGQTAQGASTLTMQYVRNVLKSDPSLTPAEQAAATADTPARKVQEIRYAVALEQSLSKEQILERYLNIAYFGDNAYGIYAASRNYFSTTPDKLTLEQAALLAGIVQSPEEDNPTVTANQPAALDRRSYVLKAMAKMGVITDERAAQVSASVLTLAPSAPPPVGCTAATTDWGFYCDYLVQWWQNQAAFGTTPAQRLAALSRGGYRIVSALDPGTQAAALKQSLSVYGYDNRRALPIAVVTPGTGRVQALAVNRHYSVDPNPGKQNGYPNTVNQLVAGSASISGYQSGSTFKMFTMLAALEAGYPLDTTFDAPARLTTSWPASGAGSCGGYYCPANENPSWMDGQRTMWTGFGRSVNTYFVWLEQRIGADRAVAMARKLGITFRAAADETRANSDAVDWGSFTLGVADTTPLDLAAAYATVAAEGMYCAPLPVMSITDTAGVSSAAANPTCQRAVSVDVARAATDAARCPVGQDGAFHQCDGGTATAATGILGGRPMAGKTGSSENNATETFVGFTPQAAAAGIAANPADPADAVGAGVASDVVRAVATTLATAVSGLPVLSFGVPSDLYAFGRSDPGRGLPGPSAFGR